MQSASLGRARTCRRLATPRRPPVARSLAPPASRCQPGGQVVEDGRPADLVEYLVVVTRVADLRLVGRGRPLEELLAGPRVGDRVVVRVQEQERQPQSAGGAHDGALGFQDLSRPAHRRHPVVERIGTRGCHHRGIVRELLVAQRVGHAQRRCERESSRAAFTWIAGTGRRMPTNGDDRTTPVTPVRPGRLLGHGGRDQTAHAVAQQHDRASGARAGHLSEKSAGVCQVVVEALDVAAPPRRTAVAAQVVGEHGIATRRHGVDQEVVAATVLAVAVDDGEHGGRSPSGDQDCHTRRTASSVSKSPISCRIGASVTPPTARTATRSPGSQSRRRRRPRPSSLPVTAAT